MRTTVDEGLIEGLPSALRRMLDAHAGPLLAPVRGEIFGPQRYALHARSLGLTHEARRLRGADASFFPRLRDNIRMLRLAHEALLGQAAAGEDASPASLWLLDNFHLIDAQLLAIHEGLPRSFFRALPVLRAEPLAGLPRIYGLAWDFVAHTDSAFDEDLLVQVLCAYQETRELRLAEMWALPTALRAVLVENLRRLAERLATYQAARELANRCCDEIDRGMVPALQPLLDRVVLRGAGAEFLSQLGRRLLDRAGPAPQRLPAELQGWLAEALPQPGLVQQLQSMEQTADNLSVSNAVAALRALGDADWPDIVGRSSPLMRAMLAWPPFAAEHHSTRDDTLHAIERLARRSRRTEMQVAQALLGLMRSHPGDDDAGTVASHWLQGPGQAQLGAVLGVAMAWQQPLRLLRARLALPLYLAIGALATATLVALVVHESPPLAWPMVLLLAWPAAEAAIALLHRLVGEWTPPQRLPRLALAAGIPAGHRVLVVIPALLSSAAVVEALAHRLRLHWLANAEPMAQFALLSDWPDADAARSALDPAMLDEAVRQVDALNALHPVAAGPPRFLLLHRRRRFSRGERRWMGWERKRGKLEQLVALLAADPLAPAEVAAFVDLGSLSVPAAGTRYIVTLDSDTQLPPGRLRELVGVAAHPANRPRLGADGGRVVAGFGILQPRLVTPLPQPQEDTYFHRMFAGQCGMDPYSAASSEVYQDLFGEGSFTGKGLLDVQALHAVLGGRLPEGQVLSHDLLEGALARCAVVSDITLVEDAPFHAEVAASRVHRWTRGDWQLLPILLRSLVQPSRYPLGAVNRWKMADNLRRTLVAPAALLLLLLVLSGRVAAPPFALAAALVAAAFAAGPLLGALAGLVASRVAVARLHFYRQGALDLLRVAGGLLWHGAMLLQHAVLAVDAIARTLWRLLVSHRRLLQWTTAAAAQDAASASLHAALRRHWSMPLVGALVGFALWRLQAPQRALGLALCAVWGAAPLWSWLVSRSGLTRQPGTCPPADAAYLHGVARDTWRYFERCVTAADLHLPPDNLQTHPHPMLAHRTSPTNIGLYLLSTACARAFGWIDTAQLLQRLQDTLATLEQLPRHRGHFLNWYDTQSGMPLLPMYVSTVDSGNLCGHLLAVAQACVGFACEGADGADATQTAALRALARRCSALAQDADFSFLYHPRRHLLHIGWRVAEQQLDAGFYDLLASESRLTSLFAIAKGDVPVRHWQALGRPFFAVHARAGLQSWSGSMFEYLMPTLVLAEPHGSVLAEAGLAALVEQRAYTAPLRLPWGISESAYAGCDHTLAYQYAPQGVPRLALRRTPADELVIAPYASALAAQLDAAGATRNLVALQALGARGRLGFIEALDYTPARQVGGQAMTPVQTFMAHHQGMTLVALANVLLDGVAQRWGMADPQLQAVVSLLHERAPREVSRLHARPAEPPPLQRHRVPTLQREVRPGQHAVEPTHLLGNGRYSVALRANGAGHSRWGGVDVTRWRDDALRDAHGTFFWLRRAGAANAFSLTQHPAPDPAARYSATFHADRVACVADWPDLQVHITVWVSPEDDIEFRQVELRNRGDAELALELVSCFEPTLAEARADEAHPAFGNLFIGARCDTPLQALLFDRRPRLTGEAAVHAAHFMAECGPALQGLRFEVDRQRWLGRNRAPHAPLAATRAWPDAAADGQALDTGLDPVCALGAQLRIAPGRSVRLCFATAAAADEATLRAVVDKHHRTGHADRAALMSATLTSIRLRELRIGAETFTTMQSLTTALLLTLSRPQPAATVPQALDRRLLWRFGISGDRPLVLVSAAALPGLGLVRSLGQALGLWAWGGVACDLVVIDSEPVSYAHELQRELAALRDRHDADAAARGGPSLSGWHLLRADDLSADELHTLQGLARVQLLADGRSLAHHLDEWAGLHEASRQQRRQTSHAVLPAAAPAAGAVALSAGRFASAGDEAGGGAREGDFTFDVGLALRPQRPWVNVIANPGFGTLVSEAGGGMSWAGNSRLNQLTPWSNDAVADAPGEWLLVQDLRTREVWSLNPSAAAAAGVTYRVTHGAGSTGVAHQRDGLHFELHACVDPVTAVKQVHLRVANQGPRTRALRLVGVCEWLLGAQRSDRAGVRTAHHAQELAGRRLTVLLATQQERSAGFGGGTAFLAALGDAETEPEDWTCDRRECFDARGRPVLPDHYGHQQGRGGDPCAALSLWLELRPGETAERTLLLGWAASPALARQLAAQAAGVAPAQRRRAAQGAWDALLDRSVVKTPDPLFDALMNRWLLVQAVSCRLWGKAGFYQAGGATGFRDQLQDTLALAWAAPRLLREQILRCAGRQFVEGDVQHWWHEPTGAGVRTHFSDDLLWLPYALAHYLRHSDDEGLLDERLPFIESPPIPAGAEDLYDTPTVSLHDASVYEHAARTIDRSLRVGVHGLPLMGSGDWNDGMNRVGDQGRGESVWLAWFLCRVVADFAPVALRRGEAERAQRWAAAASGWRAALEAEAWDGGWYLRAFFDDGQPLGSHLNAEARIDLIAQAWSVLSGAAPPARQALAMAAVQTELVDAGAGLVRLLQPPLALAQPNAGYIQAYPAGVRENGGQYSHAGVWALMAQAALAKTAARPGPGLDLAWQMFTCLSPAHRAADPARAAAYGAEPYAIAGDVYSAAPHVGRAGWSWYTGAAAWLHRAGIESIFGLVLDARSLHFEPGLPSHWPQAELTLRRDHRTMRFLLLREDPAQALAAAAVAAWAAGESPALLLPGAPLDWTALPAAAAFVVPLGAAAAG